MGREIHRLVREIHRRWASGRASDELDSRLEIQELDELQSRVERIRAMGDRFAFVGLSSMAAPETVSAGRD